MHFIKTHFHRILVILGIIVGLYKAYTLAWVCDDAYISFIYARNFYEGIGLIFQAGERVEGMSNFLWTIFLSISYVLGIRVENFAIYLGLVFYLLTIIQIRNPYLILSYSLFPFGWEFATSGLETSLYTFLILSSYQLWKKEKWSELIFLSSVLPLVRPDGAIFTIGNMILMIYHWKMGIFKKEFWRSLQGFYILMSLFCCILFLSKVLYYGDFLPNTYYAKADMGSYWQQGLLYLYYFQKEFVILSVFLIFGIVFSKSGYSWLVLTYIVYVMYVGGDFMFARFLVPIIPVSMILTWDRLSETSRVWKERFGRKGMYFSKGILLIFLFSTCIQTGSFTKDAFRILQEHGISHEREMYKSLGKKGLEYDESSLEGFRVSFWGTQAHFIYFMRPELAIESSTGLTDPHIARTKPLQRGVIGHEKTADLNYLKSRNVEIVMMDIFPELQDPGRNLYYNWNGNKLLWKVIRLTPDKLKKLEENPQFDTSYLNPNLWD